MKHAISVHFSSDLEIKIPHVAHKMWPIWQQVTALHNTVFLLVAAIDTTLKGRRCAQNLLSTTSCSKIYLPTAPLLYYHCYIMSLLCIIYYQIRSV
jgi:hypothetical protein